VTLILLDLHIAQQPLNNKALGLLGVVAKTH